MNSSVSTSRLRRIRSRISGTSPRMDKIDSERLALGLRVAILQRMEYLLVIGGLITATLSFLHPIETTGFFSVQPGMIAAAAMLVNVILLKITRKPTLIASLSVFIIFALLTYMVLRGVEGTTITFWFFQFIIFAYLLTSVRQGILWILTLIGLFILVIILSNAGFLAHKYDTNTVESLILTAAVSTMLIYAYESSIKQYISIISGEERQLDDRSARFQALVSSIGDGLIATDEKGTITFINDVALQMLGVESIEKLEHIVGSPIGDIVQVYDEHDQLVPVELTVLSSVKEEGRRLDTTAINHHTYYYRRQDGSRFPVAIVTAPIKTGNRIIGTVQVFRDVTVETQINDAKDEFVSLASHQLRTPITVIKWHLEQLRKRPDFNASSVEQQQLVDEITRAADDMSELVGALLDVSRLELGTIQLDKKPIDLVDIAKEVMQTLESTAAEKHLIVQTDYPPRPLQLNGDRRFVKMVIENLLTNAIKYTDQGSINLSLREVTDNQNVGGNELVAPGYLFEITDTGRGIPYNQHDQIFTKLFRADNVKNTDVSGTGLGLYLVRLIVEKMEGTVWFTSELGRGSQFYIFIPTTKAKEGL